MVGIALYGNRVGRIYSLPAWRCIGFFGGRIDGVLQSRLAASIRGAACEIAGFAALAKPALETIRATTRITDLADNLGNVQAVIAAQQKQRSRQSNQRQAYAADYAEVIVGHQKAPVRTALALPVAKDGITAICARLPVSHPR
jgi:hypothetical protein